MKKYFGWLCLIMASLTAVSAYAYSDAANGRDQDEIAIGDDQDDLDQEMEEVEE